MSRQVTILTENSMEKTLNFFHKFQVSEEEVVFLGNESLIVGMRTSDNRYKAKHEMDLRSLTEVEYQGPRSTLILQIIPVLAFASFILIYRQIRWRWDAPILIRFGIVILATVIAFRIFDEFAVRNATIKLSGISLDFSNARIAKRCLRRILKTRKGHLRNERWTRIVVGRALFDIYVIYSLQKEARQ